MMEACKKLTENAWVQVCNPLLPWELGRNDHHIASGRFWTILDHIGRIFKVKSFPIIFDLIGVFMVFQS